MKTFSRTTLLLALIFGMGRLCPAAENPAPPTLRLDGTARPTGYAADLTIVPEQDHFSGSIDIDLQLSEPKTVLWLNATNLDVGRAALSVGSTAVPARVVPGGEDFVGFELPGPAGPGAARLHVEYTGILDRKATQGLFRQQDGGRWYAFSQFEAVDARRAFPCFDEPAHKVPWQLTLHVPRKDTAVSNTAVESETVDAGGKMKAVRFRRTRPLPSYLVALGVGPFDVVDAGTAGANHTPLRIIALAGKGSQAAYAARTMGPLLDLLEKYFGIPYPYEKLDSLAVPITVGFGAMENAGLITYAEPLLLAAPGEHTVAFERRCASVAAHEMAHQWTGDLVTLAWWDDVWLNESFADWMENKIIGQWKPEWGGAEDRVASRSRALASDTLVTSRKIRQPIRTKDDILNVFDGITYGKGAAVLAMFESWMGPEKFQAGVRRYLRAHADGNATARDFLEALEAEGQPGVGKAFSTFLDQTGAPLVTAAVDCGSSSAATLKLDQRRLLPLGSKGSTDERWDIPVCLRESAGGAGRRSCTLLTAASAAISLPEPGCPSWILANDGASGYYRTLYPGDGFDRLLAGHARELTAPERIGLVGDLVALAEEGDAGMDASLAVVPEFAGDSSRRLVQLLAGFSDGLHAHLVPQRLEPNYERFIRSVFGTRAHALGLAAKPGESEDAALLRPDLVSLVAVRGEDRELQAQAEALARRWLKDRSAIGADMAAAVLMAAARHGTRELFEAFLAEVKKDPSRPDRRRLLEALGSFPDPALRQEAFRLLLAPEVDPREALVVFYAASDDPEGREAAYDFLKANFNAIAARIPAELTVRLIRFGEGFCDEAHRRDVESFFSGKTSSLPGSPRILAQTLERIGLCEAVTARQEPEVDKFLEKY